MLFIKLNIQRFAEDGTIIIGTEINTDGVSEGVKDIKDIVEDETPEIDLKVDKQSKGLKTISNFAKTIASKFLGISKASLSFLGNIVKLVGKLGLLGGLIGSILLIGVGISQAFKTAINSDEELKKSVEDLKLSFDYLKYSLGSAFSGIAKGLISVIKWVIDIIYKAIIGIGGVIKLITGKNIFKKSGIKDFEKSLKSGDKTAKSLQKTLTGFDEIDMLNGGSGSGSGLSTGILGDLDKLTNISEEVEKMSDKIKNWFTGGYDNFFTGLIEEAKKLPTTLKNIFAPAYNNIIKPYIVDPTIQGFKSIWSLLEPYLKPIWNNLKTEWNKVVEELKPAWNGFINYLKPAWKKFTDEILPTIKSPFQNAIDQLKTLFAPFFNDIIKWINQTFGIFGIKIDYISTEWETKAENTTKNVKKDIGSVGTSIDNLSKKEINIKTNTSQISKLKTTLDDIIKNMIILAGGTVTTTWTTKANPKQAKGAIIYPKLAAGGIVNQPGRGINYHGANIAERGAEGIIPLTDSQQMALLGEAIGKYITINANIVNTMNGRVISKELQKVQNDSDFAFNR